MGDLIVVHEWALAEAIIATVEKIAKENKAVKIGNVRISIGALQTIDTETLFHALKSLREEASVPIENFVFEEEECEFKCNRCGATWSAYEVDPEAREAIHFIPETAHLYIQCPKCGSTDFRVTKGRGVYIKSVEVIL